jgi:glycosyltransferase involved in cell wall biosynthesis
VLTVLLATRNGATTLPGVLESYTKLESPRGGWKLVVVDNGSTDATRQVIGSFEDRLPLSYLFEPRAGKNTALNSGLTLVSGDLVVLSDDDAFPKQDWLSRLRCAADANPTADVFGGPVVPRWEIAPKASLLKWVPLAWTYTVSESGRPEGPVDGRHIFGPNMAVRTSIFDAGHRFDPSIGPNGSRAYAMGSETEFLLRVMARGARACYVPTAVVEHFVRASSMKPAWVIRRAVRAGRGECRFRSQYRLEGQPIWGFRRPPRLTPRWLGVPLPLVYHLGLRAGAVLLRLPMMNRAELFRSLWFLAFHYGFTREAIETGWREASAAPATVAVRSADHRPT